MLTVQVHKSAPDSGQAPAVALSYPAQLLFRSWVRMMHSSSFSMKKSLNCSKSCVVWHRTGSAFEHNAVPRVYIRGASTPSSDRPVAHLLERVDE